MTVPFMKSGDKLSILANGKWYQIASDHPKYAEILEALHGTEDEIVKLIDMEAGVREYFNGSNVEVVNGFVKYNGEVVDTTLTKRILQFMREGLPFEPLVKFFENLMLNPSYRARQELYDFLENKNLPITEDGCFMAYKAVNSNYMDKWSGSINNSVGQVVEIDRGKVDDDREMGCSHGLHCGALDYVRSYGSEGGGDHVMIVKIHPADAVSVPSDCEFMKLRTCKYEVLSETEWADELRKPLYAPDGQEYVYHNEFEPYLDSDDEEWFDDNYDDYDDDGDDGDEPSDPVANQSQFDYFKKVIGNDNVDSATLIDKIKKLIRGGDNN